MIGLNTVVAISIRWRIMKTWVGFVFKFRLVLVPRSSLHKRMDAVLALCHRAAASLSSLFSATAWRPLPLPSDVHPADRCRCGGCGWLSSNHFGQRCYYCIAKPQLRDHAVLV